MNQPTGAGFNARWALIENAPIMNQLWQIAQRPNLPRRAMFDARIALTLRHHGVTDWATRNVSDFQEFGFAQLINPIDDPHPAMHEP